jgi:hypothetical protein
VSLSAVDPKIVSRIQKLLALARDGGATEAEAETAMSMAQAAMMEHNISVAMVEAGGGQSDDTRTTAETEGRAMYEYQRNLMAAVAKVNFCSVNVVTEKRWKRRGFGTKRSYQIIGRVSNVTSAQQMFDYLCSTIERVLGDHIDGNSQRMSRFAMSFKEGCADRLIARLQERHRAQLREQKRRAAEENARRAHPSYASDGKGLVVIMEDYEQRERDLNWDHEYGLAPGTTARERAQRQAEYAAWRAANPPAPPPPAEPKVEKPLTDRQRRRQEERDARAHARWRARWDRQEAKRDHRGYEAGTRAGDSIGLDEQVDRASRRSIG